MSRKHFLILGSLALCLIPILGTVSDADNPPHRTVQVETEQLTYHW